MTTKAKVTHTPGPWRHEADFERFGDHRCAVFADDAPPGRKLPAIVDTEANARLIAAAPQLAEACKAALSRICSDVCGTRHVAECEQLRAALKAAGIDH